MDVCADLSPKLGFLLKPARYKVLYGGRGSGRSWACAIVLLIECLHKPHRVLCAREFQNSINESVHTLLCLQIQRLGLQAYYDIQATSIRCTRTGAEFIFAGLRRNINNTKSMEGITRVWCEEAHTISKASWDVLIPTIRTPGSEIWVTFNPELDTDETYKRFVLNPPTNAVVCKMNWHDNPWFPDVLLQEKDDLKERDYDAYLNVWEGHCRQSVDGAVYAKEIRAAMESGRITRVLPIAGKPVETFWDLGKRDHTAIWFAQINMGEYRILDFYQNRGQDLPHYFEEIAKRKYRLGTIWLPHDASQDRLTGSIDRVIRAAYPNNTVRVIPRMAKKAIGIEAVRGIFPYCYFDEEKCADGLQAMRRFQYDVDQNGQYSKDPLHDENSDACLTGDSVIYTERGNIPIAEVAIGDQVWTPRGFAEVTNAGMVKKSTSLIKIETKSGAVLTCTPEHKVLTQKGFVRADALRYSDRIFSGKELPCVLSSLLSTVINSGFRETITKPKVGQKVAQAHCIGLFGNFIMAQFLMDSMYIIKTKIPSIMLLTTLKPLMQSSTKDFTCLNAMLKENYTLHRNSLYKKLLYGTLPKKVLNGIKPMERKHGKIVNGIHVFVMNAVRILCRLFLLAPNTANGIAKLQRIEGEKGCQWVYDLTVQNHGCYQANGLLVSNCDAFAQMALSLKENKPKPVVKQIEVSRFGGIMQGLGWMG